MRVVRLKINGVTRPVGYTCDVLNVSWNIEDAAGKYAETVKIEVAEDADFRQIIHTAENNVHRKEHKTGTADFSEELSGRTCSAAGTALEIQPAPRTRYYVRVTVTDDCGDCGTGVTWFETGKLSEQWQASWIGPQKEDTFHPVLRKTFSSKKKPAAARLYICGLGVYEAYLNGNKIGDDVLAPFLNDYRFALQTQTYDVTEMLIPGKVQEEESNGENTLEILLGNGWYKGRFGQGTAVYGDRFAAIAELHLTYEDGSREVISTDSSWHYRGSDVEESGIYDGEVLNRMLWENRENIWKPVEILDLDRRLLTDRYSIPVIVKERMPVKKILKTPAGETVLDMGQNFSGWLVFQSRLPKGTKVHLEFGEVLQNGNFYNENYRTATGGFTYVSNGESELVRPHFTYFGFRYVKLSGWTGTPEKEDFLGYVIYSDLERTGYLETSDEKVNQLISNSLWGQKSNFLDMPTDCPQRDERLGWTADAQVFSPTATYHMDTRAFYRKYLWDMRNVQEVMNGAVPAYLPAAPVMCPVCSVWGDAAVIIPYTIWKFYSNRDEMECMYPLMKDWVNYVSGEMVSHYGKPYGIWDFTFHFGDWLALDGADEQALKGSTPDGYLATMYYYQSIQIVAEIAGKLGKESERKKYTELAQSVKECLLSEYFTPAGHLSVNTQAAYLVALKFGVYREKEVVVRDFLQLLELQQYRIKCGFVGAPMLCQVLSECGQDELAYRFLFQEGFPSWLYAVNLGATTIWERWNSLLPDGSVSGTGMNSLNHYSYGSVIEFLYAYAAGLRPADAGFERAVIAPMPNKRMRKLNCTYRSPVGKYVVNWELRDDGTVKIHLEIPFGCRAEVRLPESGKDPFAVEAGIYDYEYVPLQDYRQKYNRSTLLKEIFADPEAKEILFKIIPQAGMLENPIDTNTRLGDLYDRTFMGIAPEDIDQAVKELELLKLW